jgi:hypothetical protein
VSRGIFQPAVRWRLMRLGIVGKLNLSFTLPLLIPSVEGGFHKYTPVPKLRFGLLVKRRRSLLALRDVF